jgi:hypothetical protein
MIWDTGPSFPSAQPGPVARDPAQRCPDKPDIPRARGFFGDFRGFLFRSFRGFFAATVFLLVLPLHIPTDLVATRFPRPAVRVQVEHPRAQRFGRDLLKTYPRPRTSAEVPGQARHPPRQGVLPSQGSSARSSGPLQGPPNQTTYPRPPTYPRPTHLPLTT